MAVLIALAGCELFGGGTKVRFLNATSSYTFTSISFASVLVSSTLGPGQETPYVTVSPGQDLLIAQIQGRDQTNGIQFTIVAGHSYTITFSVDATSTLVVSITTDS